MVAALPPFLERNKDWLVVRPSRILLIVVLALIVRALAHRVINRLVRSTAESSMPRLPRREGSLVNGLLESAGLLSERRRQRTEAVGSIMRSIASVVILTTAVMLILDQLQLNLAPVLASASIAGVAFGFGAQSLVRDFIAGVFMILEDQYGVGDVVDLGQAAGTVEAVGLRTTRLRDTNGAVWYVRNGEIVRVGNNTQGFAQVVLDVPVQYGTDLDAAGNVLLAVATDLADDENWADPIVGPPELLGVESFTDSGVVLRLSVRTRPADQWRVARELRRRLVNRFGTERITFGYPGAKIEPAPPPSAAPDGPPAAPAIAPIAAGPAPSGVSTSAAEAPAAAPSAAAKAAAPTDGNAGRATTRRAATPTAGSAGTAEHPPSS